MSGLAIETPAAMLRLPIPRAHPTAGRMSRATSQVLSARGGPNTSAQAFSRTPTSTASTDQWYLRRAGVNASSTLPNSRRAWYSAGRSDNGPGSDMGRYRRPPPRGDAPEGRGGGHAPVHVGSVSLQGPRRPVGRPGGRPSRTDSYSSRRSPRRIRLATPSKATWLQSIVSRSPSGVGVTRRRSAVGHGVVAISSCTHGGRPDGTPLRPLPDTGEDGVEGGESSPRLGQRRLVDRSPQLDYRRETHRRGLVDSGHGLVGQTDQVVSWMARYRPRY